MLSTPHPAASSAFVEFYRCLKHQVAIREYLTQVTLGFKPTKVLRDFID
jgi:hypothetical protein